MAVLANPALKILPAIILPILLAADAGRVTLTRFSVPDDANEAGRAAATSIQYVTTATPDEAQTAFTAAQQVATSHGEALDPKSFTIYQDGSVKLTVSKSTQTILFGYLPGLDGLTHTSVTTTVPRANW